MFKKNLGGIIKVDDGDEDTMDTGVAVADAGAPVENAPVNEDIWDSDEEQAAKREMLEQATVIGRAAAITGDLAAKGPITIGGTVKGNIDCEDKICIKGDVTGNLTGKSVLVVGGGSIRGNVTSATDLALQVGASVEGDLVAAEMTVEGSVTGNVNCSGNLNLGSKSSVTGDISTKDITTSLGAHINGRVEMK